jgi:ribosomal protein S18 acetylase RimI-like enzyme
MIEIDKALIAAAQNASEQMNKHECEHETLALSDRDRDAFFEALIGPPKSSDAVETVLGYYTLCAASLPQGDAPAAARKHIPRYPLVSATRIGRLAMSRTRQGDGLGPLLLADAVKRAYASAETVGSSMLVVDALNERAAAFYESFGFQPLPESLRLVCRCARSRKCSRDENGRRDEVAAG